MTGTGRTLAAQATKLARDVDTLFFGAEATALRATLRGIAQHR